MLIGLLIGLFGLVFLVALTIVNVWLVAFGAQLICLRSMALVPRALIAFFVQLPIAGIVMLGPWEGLTAFGWTVAIFEVLAIPALIVSIRWFITRPQLQQLLWLKVLLLVPLIGHGLVVLGMLAMIAFAFA